MTASIGLLSFVLMGPPEDPSQAMPDDAALAGDPAEPAPVDSEPVIRDPDAVVAEPRPGGFGSVSNVQTESDVHVVGPDPALDEEAEEGRRSEVGGRVSVGFGQTDVRNDRAWDHAGAALGAVLQWYPYVTPRRHAFGIGVELGYSYQGLIRNKLPALTDAPFAKSKVQQHFVDLGLALLLRPHPEWFSIQPTASIGFAFYTGNQIYAREQRAELPGRSSALGVATTLALCTAWDIVCVVGGYRWTDGLDGAAALDGQRFRIPTGTWHVGLGFDVLRVMTRLNEGPSAR